MTPAPDYERLAMPNPSPFPDSQAHDIGASIRVLLQGLILAAILGLVGIVIQQGKDQQRSDEAKSVQIATLQAQIASLTASLAGLPDLGTRVTSLEARQVDLIRRVNNDDARWDRIENRKTAGWNR